MPSALARSRRFRALVVTLSVAFAVAGAFQPRAEAAPRYLLCELKDGSLLYIVVANFGDIKQGDVLEGFIMERVAAELGA